MNADLEPRPSERRPVVKPLAEESPDWILDTRQMTQPRLGAVIDALGDAEVGDTVVVITPISPVPLYDHLNERGWGYEVDRISPDEWQVRITVGEQPGDSGERLRRPRRRRLR
ncbi:DUF2249 domain-containing protein [Natronomonas halophila]|uniref:DUF2249 domain-containing protein n=1 Tax=Natronomonas halophila TaxID=2747817 RepID=UPI0015B5EFAF|nr:DUF2249 domain-containing protein [Natronomonas halophila]QLD84505.1 DUF2249 domain-containing protein [Natronomonas halophila]